MPTACAIELFSSTDNVGRRLSTSSYAFSVTFSNTSSALTKWPRRVLIEPSGRETNSKNTTSGAPMLRSSSAFPTWSALSLWSAPRRWIRRLHLQLSRHGRRCRASRTPTCRLNVERQGFCRCQKTTDRYASVSYTHLRAHETVL